MPFHKNRRAYARLAAAGAAAVAARRRKAPTKSKPRRRTRKRSATKSKRKSGETHQVEGYTRKTTTLGRSPRQTLGQAWKMLKGNKKSTYFGMRQYNQFGGAVGQVPLHNTSNAGASWLPPIVLYDLTSQPNVINNTLVYTTPCWKPVFTTVTDVAALQWAQNINAVQWAVENSATSAALLDTFAGAECILDWAQIKLLFYAATTQTQRYQVDVVQIKDDRLVPDAANTSQFACAFWQAAVKKFAYSSLEPGAPKYSRYFKILHSQTWIMDSKDTIETEQAHMRELSVFLKLNRRCKFDWEDHDRMNLLNVEGQTNTDQNIKTTVHPKARIFLMIRAQSKYTSVYTHDPTIHPSFDIVLRTKMSQLSG